MEQEDKCPSLFDSVRGKNVKRTPEEEVRQAIVAYLLEGLKVPKRLIAVEYSLAHIGPGLRHRADIVVWKPSAINEMLKPWLLVECKAPKVNLKQSVENQASFYLKFFPSEYLMLSNGHDSLYFHLENKEYHPISSLPYYPK